MINLSEYTGPGGVEKKHPYFDSNTPGWCARLGQKVLVPLFDLANQNNKWSMRTLLRNKDQRQLDSTNTFSILFEWAIPDIVKIHPTSGMEMHPVLYIGLPKTKGSIRGLWSDSWLTYNPGMNKIVVGVHMEGKDIEGCPPKNAISLSTTNPSYVTYNMKTYMDDCDINFWKNIINDVLNEVHQQKSI